MLRQRRGFSNYPLSEQRKSQLDYQLPSRINEALMSEEITIKFVGDMQENIEQIISNLHCAEQTRQQIRSILRIYAAKVSKLREERNFYKELLFIRQEKDTFEINKLKNQLQSLKQNKERLVSKGNCQRCTCFQESQFRTSKFSQSGQDNQLSRATVHSFCSHPLSKHYPSASLPPRESIPCEDQMLISSKSSHCVADSLQVSETLKQALEEQQRESSRCNATITEEQLTRLMLKYNISTEELEQIFREYDRENKQAFQLFDSSRQRQLYKLGQRMQKDLWNRKIVKDIRKMSDLKPF